MGSKDFTWTAWAEKHAEKQGVPMPESWIGKYELENPSPRMLPRRNLFEYSKCCDQDYITIQNGWALVQDRYTSSDTPHIWIQVQTCTLRDALDHG